MKAHRFLLLMILVLIQVKLLLEERSGFKICFIRFNSDEKLEIIWCLLFVPVSFLKHSGFLSLPVWTWALNFSKSVLSQSFWEVVTLVFRFIFVCVSQSNIQLRLFLSLLHFSFSCRFSEITSRCCHRLPVSTFSQRVLERDTFLWKI